MGSVRAIHFRGGPKNGKVYDYAEPLPPVLVFQGTMDSIFKVVSYERIQNTNIYRYKEEKQWNLSPKV